MSEAAFAAQAAYVAGVGEQLSATQATAAQAARFQSLLTSTPANAQTGPAYYGPPEMERSYFRPVFNNVSKLSNEFRANFDGRGLLAQLPPPPDAHFDAGASSAVNLAELARHQKELLSYKIEVMSRINEMHWGWMQFKLIGKQIEMGARNVQTLYQQSS